VVITVKNVFYQYLTHVGGIIFSIFNPQKFVELIRSAGAEIEKQIRHSINFNTSNL